jgi:hypothetical protein
MPAASGAKGDIVLSAPTDSINDILDVLTKDDYEGESRELSGPPQTSALIVRTIGKNQTTREFTPTTNGLILHFFGEISAGAGSAKRLFVHFLAPANARTDMMRLMRYLPLRNAPPPTF